MNRLLPLVLGHRYGILLGFEPKWFCWWSEFLSHALPRDVAFELFDRFLWRSRRREAVGSGAACLS